MKSCAFLIFWTVIAHEGYGQSNPVTLAVLEKCLLIGPQVDSMKATAFPITVSNRIYIITARHVLANRVHHGNKFHCVIGQPNGDAVPINARCYFHADTSIDVAVIVPEKSGDGITIPWTTSTSIGDEVWVVGYPQVKFGKLPLVTQLKDKPTHYYPLVMNMHIAGYNHPFCYLDGSGFPGMSGSAVFALDTETKNLRIIGVFIGENSDPLNVVTIDSVMGKPSPTQYYTLGRSALSHFVPIEFALEIIDSIRD